MLAQLGGAPVRPIAMAFVSLYKHPNASSTKCDEVSWLCELGDGKPDKENGQTN